MKKRLTSQALCQDEVDRLQEYTIKLMHHQEAPAHQLIQKINQIVVSFSGTQSKLKEIAKEFGVAFGVDSCCLAAITSEKESTRAACWYVEGNEQKSSETRLASKLFHDFVVQYACNPSPEESRFRLKQDLENLFQDLPVEIGSVLAIPTYFSGQQNGIIYLIKSQPYNWSDSEKELLASIASSVAIAFSLMAQAQLITAQEENLLLRDQYQNLIKELTILCRTSNQDLNQLLKNIIARTAQSLKADRGLAILLKYADPLFKSRAKKLVPQATATVVGEWLQTAEPNSVSLPSIIDSHFWVHECVLCQNVFLESQKAVIITDNTDTSESTRIDAVNSVASVFSLEKLPSLLLVPFENQGKILGFLVLQHSQARQWQPEELNVLEMVGAQISNAIIHTQTLRQVQILVEERTEQLRRALDVQGKLYERTRQYVEQLRELNEFKDEFVSNISDRLRYPLTNMRLAIRNLRQPGVADERKAKYLDILEQQCTQEINLINDLLTLNNLRTHQEPLRIETINLNEKIQDLIAFFENKFGDKGLAISVTWPNEPLTCQTDVESLERILQELLTNAGKYSQPNTPVTVEAFHQVKDVTDQIVIKVTNIGRSISDEEGTYIFDLFRRGRGGWTPGTGLGLALVKALVQHLNGTIALESTPTDDPNQSKICFTLTLNQFSEDSRS